jgi:HPt (histidine-containing phosphotransfer) domain-containing protein
MSIDSDVLDVSVVAAIRALGDPGQDVFEELARIFLADVPVHLAALDDAIASGRTASVWQIAHGLRGSSLEMGAVRMAPLCAVIEGDARAGVLDDAAPCADALSREFAALQVVLEQVIGA